jgi:RND family efflux transporter MFP subunit
MENNPLGPSNPKKLRYLKIVLPFLILITGLAISWYIYKTAPKARKKTPARPVEHVRVMSVQRSTEKIILHAMGSVIPARTILLKPRVSGKIIDISPKFMIGGCFNKGDFILQIDPEDYKLALKRKESKVTLATGDLRLESGRQDVARHEWKLLNQNGDELDRDLALRRPQLEKATAALLAARSEFEQSRLDLERTSVNSPYNSVILDKSVDIGSQVSTQESLAVLAGTDEFWIKVSIPVERLQWLAIPGSDAQSGSQAKIIYGNNHRRQLERKGKVIKLLANLEPEGRMARILVSIDDPLGLNPDSIKAGTTTPPLLIGDYVRVQIYGRSVKGVFKIPRTALHNDSVWVVTEDKRLDIRAVEIIWKDMRTALIRNSLNDNEKIVVSDIAAPIADMPLKILTK